MSDIDRAGAVLTIDLGAIRRNYADLRGRLGSGARLAAAVKADAYGLGAIPVARALADAGCVDFLTATLDEAIVVREGLDRPNIYVLNGPPPGTSGEFLNHRLIPVLNDLDQIARWAAESTDAPAALHVDSGMCRLGLSEADVERLRAAPGQLDRVRIALLVSHLACADDAGHPMNAAQRTTFIDRIAALPEPARRGAEVSLANSSGIFLGPDFHFDMARAGAALYGINPCPGTPNPMAEVVRLQGKIVQVRDVDSPMTVGYGASHRVTRKGRIATVPVGYADGFIRALGNRASGYIGAVRVPVVGRVSMDALTLDVSHVSPRLAMPGSIVDLIGGARPLDSVAAEAGTIGYEVLTGLGPGRRVPRQYLDGDA
ncbi:MAG: alanine racemase [Alphaproteobacteria bacterium]|jgi:alanine racemase|nr:alanine racemase [Alphaproteobacteria bacterium]